MIARQSFFLGKDTEYRCRHRREPTPLKNPSRVLKLQTVKGNLESLSSMTFELPQLDKVCRSQWSRGLRRRSAASRVLRLWVRFPLGAWIFVCFECCALSGRGLCDELITHPDDSYRLWCFVVYDLESTWMRTPLPTGSCSSKNKQTNTFGVR